MLPLLELKFRYMLPNGVFIIYRKERRAKALLNFSFIEFPDSLMHEGREYKEDDQYPGDFDHLVDQSGQLVGFSFSYYDLYGDALRNGRFLSECQNVCIDEYALNVYLTECTTAEPDLWQVLGASLYTDGENDQILLLPIVEDWRSNPNLISFSIESNDGPKIVTH